MRPQVQARVDVAGVGLSGGARDDHGEHDGDAERLSPAAFSETPDRRQHRRTGYDPAGATAIPPQRESGYSHRGKRVGQCLQQESYGL
jgi:hypothetical protein